jgi:hypothetical protein
MAETIDAATVCFVCGTDLGHPSKYVQYCLDCFKSLPEEGEA